MARAGRGGLESQKKEFLSSDRFLYPKIKVRSNKIHVTQISAPTVSTLFGHNDAFQYPTRIVAERL